MKIALIASILLLPLFTAAQQEISIVCGTPVPTKRIYQLNGRFFTPPEYGTLLMIQRKDIEEGKHNFKRPVLGQGKLFGWPKKLPEDAVLKPYRGTGKSIDTVIFMGIKLKYPVEIDGALMKPSPNDTSILTISTFHLVRSCPNLPYKHFELGTKPSTD